jgi:4-amino-4-deoxy-L-arabinose transferase-like glycosyltransferase
MGLGVLAKGPITPMIAVLAVIALSVASRNVRWLFKLRPVLGMLIVAAIVGPWVYLVAQRVGWQTYWTTVYDETLGRSTEAKESHWGPPGYHLVLLAVLFWPGSLLTAAAFMRSWKRGFARFTLGNRPEAFLLAWVIPAWVVFEIVATKLPHYTMPMYPAIALLTARTVCAAVVGRLPFARSVMDRIGVIIWGGIGAAGLIGSLGIFVEVGGFEVGKSGAGRPFLGLAVLVLSTAIGGAVWLVLRCRVLAPAHVLAGLAMVCWCWVTLAWVAPRCERFWISSRLLAFVQRDEWEKTARTAAVAMVGYEEPSAVFLFRGRANPVSSKEFEAWVVQHPDGITLLQSEVGAIRPYYGPMGMSGVIGGFNYSTGKAIEIHIGGVLPPQQDHFHEMLH